MTPSSTSKRPRARAKGRKAAAVEPPAERPFVAHLLVPPHELLSPDESAVVLKQHGLTAERIPRILVTDAGLKTDPKFRAAREAREDLSGRLVRVRRPSPTAGEAIAYRMIVQSMGE
jgi:DNA-directed RNA polymerase subunit H (RpoH/RPB5)